MCKVSSSKPSTSAKLSDAVLELVPAHPAAQEALQFALGSCSQSIINHSFRTYLYALAFSASPATAKDRDSPHSLEPYFFEPYVLFVACILHDLAIIEEYDLVPGRFEIVAADVAIKLLRRHGVAETTLREVWLAMAIHATPGIAEHFGGSVGAVRLAISVEFGGRSPPLELMSELSKKAISEEALLPRLEIEKDLGDAVARQGRKDRKKAPSASWAGLLTASSCAATAPSVAEQVPPGMLEAAQQEQRREPEPQQTDSSTVEQTSEHGQPPAEADTPAPAPSLWDRAYLKLKESKPTLVADYEKLLSKELADGSALIKKEQLNDIATRGLERVSEQKAKYTIFGQEYVVKDQVAQVSKLLINLKSFIADAIKASPEASLAWAGVCVILPLLSNPSTADEAQSSGFDYVTSRMRLYVGFEELLWPTHTTIAPDTKQALEASVEDLYVKILTFQLTSVLRFCRGWLGQLGRDLVQYDDWKSMLEAVKKAEVIVSEDFKRLRDAAILRELEKMTSDAEAQCDSLKSLLSVAEMQLQIARELLKEAQATRKLAEARLLDIPAIYEARYDSAEVHCQARCLEGTRKQVNDRIISWVDVDKAADHLFWLNGPAGIGKSTVSRTIAGIFAAQHRLAASFFFSRSRQGKNELSHFFPTLASQVADHIPEYKSHLREALRDVTNEALLSKSPYMQFELRFTKVFEHPSLRGLVLAPQLIIIDALDEFSQQDRIGELLKPLSELRAKVSFRLCVLLTSRNTIEVEEAFGDLAGATFQSLNLHQEYSDESRADIEAYLSAIFEQLSSKPGAGSLGPWPDAADMATVIQLATTPSPLFIYASTLHKFLLQKGRGKTPRQQLKNGYSGPAMASRSWHRYISPFCRTLSSSRKRSGNPRNFGPDAADGHRIIGAVTLAGRPISATILASLLDLELDVVLQWLHSLRPVFDVGDHVDSPIKLLHKSFSDFLLDEDSRPSDVFWVDFYSSHEYMALQCFWKMKNNGLRRDICGLGELGCLSAEVEDERVADGIPSDLQYSVLFFLHHLDLSRRQRENFFCVDEFLRTQLLHWLEALALLRSTQTAVTGMTDLNASVTNKSGLTESLVHDAYRFVLAHSHTIQTAPLQAYVSALIFSPSKSFAMHFHRSEKPDWIETLSGLGFHWDPCLMTISLDKRGFKGAALSNDGSKFATMLLDVVRVYETEYWSVIGEFEIEDGSTASITFSQDNRRLAISVLYSLNNSVEIWDWSTGVRLQILDDLGYHIRHLWFYSNDEQLAISEPMSLKFVDIATGQQIRERSFKLLFSGKEVNESGSNDIVASTDRVEVARIISGQRLDNLGRDWLEDLDSETTGCGENPSNSDCVVVFSSSGELMARIGEMGGLQILSVRSGQILRSAATDYGWLIGGAKVLKFFDADKRLAHIGRDGCLRIWRVEPLVFFLDDREEMIACGHASISTWDLSHPIFWREAIASRELTKRVQSWPSISRMVTVSSEDADLTIWDTVSASRLNTLRSQPAAGGGMAASLRRGYGSLVLDAPTDNSYLAAISPNGAFLVFLMHLHIFPSSLTFHILDLRDRVQGWPATELSIPGPASEEFIFSDDGEVLVTYTRDSIYIWRLSTGWEHARQLVCTWVQRVALSPDNRYLAACGRNNRVTVWDITDVSGDPLVEFGGGSGGGDYEVAARVVENRAGLMFSSSGRYVFFRSAPPYNATLTSQFWNSDVHGVYPVDGLYAQIVFDYQLKCYRVTNGSLAFENTLPTTETAARPREVEEEGVLHVQTAYGIQKCGPAVRDLTYEGYGLSEDRVWILKGSARVLFVPATYRMKRPRIVDSVAILHHRTHIMLLQLK
ncbi:hypothetical protein NLG97_g5926 [Lecanicillium saksenae]|uniref:Uncharacterized protein n=1 Tax=Lecanicillium saksenae TaxID=468837 RepID=A0ACC1QR29_9HYPO|nr:hypothetical protein NLG97_g5926 [Lecanicillium saksenae]